MPATSRSSPKKQVGSIRARCRDCENEEGPQWIEREETFRARGSSAVRIDREEAGRYGESGRGSERGSEPCVECDQSRVRGGEDREEAKGHT